jgi:hypothetical protein
MEVISGNDGLLTNVEVMEVLKENRSRRGRVDAIKIDLQNRENVETKVRLSTTFYHLPVVFTYKQSVSSTAGDKIHKWDGNWAS